MLAELAIVLALILLNGVFAGAEIAIISLRKTRLQELVDSGRRGAVAVAELRRHPERFLATVQVGITVVSATAAAFGGASVAGDIAPILARIPLLEDSADEIALGVVVVGVSYLSLVLGELVPKSLALRAGERYALLVGRALSGLSRVARPLVWFLTASSNVVLRVFGDRTSFAESRLSPEELLQLVDEAASAGTVDPNAGEIASRALAFHELDAADLMVPPREITAIQRTANVEELARLGRERGHARVLVYGRNADDIVGFVNVRDALAAAAADPGWQLADAILTVPFVPETMRAPVLLRVLQRERTHIAVVVDEQGTLSGLVTIEDLLEELVGDILSEGEEPEALFWRDEEGVLVALGAAPVHQVNRALSLELPEEEGFSTLGGLCTHRLGRIPRAGEHLQVGDVRIEVLEATPRRVKRVRLRDIGPEEDAQ